MSDAAHATLGVAGSKKGCRKGLRERRHSRNPLTQPLFGGVQEAAGGRGRHHRQQQNEYCREVAAAAKEQRRGRIWRE